MASCYAICYASNYFTAGASAHLQVVFYNSTNGVVLASIRSSYSTPPPTRRSFIRISPPSPGRNGRPVVMPYVMRRITSPLEQALTCRLFFIIAQMVWWLALIPALELPGCMDQTFLIQ